HMTAIKVRFLYLSLALLPAVTFTPGWGQDEAFKNLQQQFEKFNQHAALEKIYLHTDKNFYLAGEIIWFKVYYVDGATHRPSNLSKIAYVEILDRSHKPVAQAKISLTGKGGSGSIYLPLTLNSDNYSIRAYTNWMKNAGPSVFFEKPISVVNTIKPVEGNFQQDSVRVTVNFFPEGGNLVQGIETKVAFQVAGKDGKGIDARGVITDDNGDTIRNFSTYRFGIGNFTFIPGAGRAYKATILLPEGEFFTSPLPAVYDYGYIMNVTDNKDGRLKVRIQAKVKETGQRGEKVFLLAHTRHVLKVAEAGYVNYENDLVLYIDKARLTEGISHFTLFNKDQQPVCERLVFTRPKDDVSVSISSGKTVYEKRQKVNLSISATGEDKPTDNINYSVSVFQMDSLKAFDGDDITSYLWLTSDLRGQVESPGFYFSNEANVDEATDNLLLTHGWRRFRWENIVEQATPAIPRFMPEYSGHLITAKVTAVNNGKAAVDVECFLSFPGSPFGFCAAKTDSKGMVYFDVKNYYGPGDIIIQAGRDTTNNYRVDILTPFADDYQLVRLPFFSFAKKEEKKLTGKSIAMQVQNIYVADSIRRFNPPVLVDTFPFFGKAEYSYRLDEYKRFTTMEEVLREYVLPVNVVLRNGKLYMNMYDAITQTIHTDNVLVLLDGVPLMNYNKIFSYDPLKVKKLDVVPVRYQIGGINFKGIASFETYQAKFDGFDLIPGIIAVDYEGLQLQREFYSPLYESNNEREKRIPDLRSTLYWTSDVSTDKSEKELLQFYTSDQKGKFLIVLQGFNAKGEPVSSTSSFRVE
ncbi:MAG TPA: hypothetical protein VJ111_04360, partial [Chitinophagaceae bacterium]|nr:hypothetical protein [Chitinophagaceae bacterium]